jgi:hypothetical protein
MKREKWHRNNHLGRERGGEKEGYRMSEKEKEHTKRERRRRIDR